MLEFSTLALTALLHTLYVCILQAGVQPTLDPYAEVFYSRPIALTPEGRRLVNDVCECMRDRRVRRGE